MARAWSSWVIPPTTWPRVWSPSPVWPEGRSVFILRPLLQLRRATLRAALTEAGETWIDDPANIDPRHARARARATLANLDDYGGEVLPAGAARRLAEVREGAGGELLIDVERLTSRHGLAAALLCASGGARPPRGARLDRLLGRLIARETLTACLAGARIESNGRRVAIVREAGEFKRAAVPPIDLPPGEAMVWDGRFEFVARRPGLSVRPLEGVARRLGEEEQAALKAVSPAARRALPVLVDEAGLITCPILAPDPRVQVRSLVLQRLAGALGMIESEGAILTRGETGWNTLNGDSTMMRRVHEFP